MRRMTSLQFLEILRRTLNKVDARLVDHGEKVGYIIYTILNAVGGFTKDEINELALLGILHDIGAYKTEEIDDMVAFENSHVWQHSIYGYLFLKNLSAMKEKTRPLLFHHASYRCYKELGLADDDVSGLIRLADRIDVITNYSNAKVCREWIIENRGTLLSPYWVDKFLDMPNHKEILEEIESHGYLLKMKKMAEELSYEFDEIESYLSVIAYTIDFRSEFMVLHTVTTVNVSTSIGERMDLDEQELSNLHFGALLHDVGKIACPVEILEKPGKLTIEEMEIMKEHVSVTQDILEGVISDDIAKIASRHHEKINGNGYPLGLSLADLTLSECICAVADIVSALIGQRSYKDAFDKDKTISILEKMRNDGELLSSPVNIVIRNFDVIMNEVSQSSKEVIQAYQSIMSEFEVLLEKYRSIEI
ncbi:3'3'-cGAMP-specific phosphodiesterase 1 [bioreactor metagenome]|uniref:3'3'-cGAMP-specific phosphodiesterase 1 n=1 Tax=bioreactor metagenome TaxID=1076179 RepID=A0A645CEE0_9ZZZZ